MDVYRLPSPRQKASNLKVIRFKYECVEACSRGTDDPREYESHLAHCKFIFPAVAAEIAKRLACGETIAVDPRRVIEDRPGQTVLPWASSQDPR